MKKTVLLIILMVFTCNLHAQFAIGPKVYARLTDDRVGPTQGIGIHAASLLYEGDTLFGIAHGGFDVSFPHHFIGGTATIDAWDSATVPYTITRTINQTVTDYMLHISFGFAINPKAKPNAWVVTFGLRPLYRRVKIEYTEPWDDNIYSRYTVDPNPDIPVALNVSFNVGAGYLYKCKWLGFYPHASFGFGANDRKDKHPWNKYPNYFELSLTVFAITKLGA